MRKETARGKLTSRRNAIECARGLHTTRSAARQEASPQIMRRSIRIAAVPQTAKHARRIAGGPQAHHRFRRARQAANRCHTSEAKTTGYRGASHGPTPWWWFPICTRTIKRCRCPACTAKFHLQNERRGRNGARGAALPHRARVYRHELPYFETIRAQRYSRGVPRVRSA